MLIKYKIWAIWLVEQILCKWRKHYYSEEEIAVDVKLIISSRAPWTQCRCALSNDKMIAICVCITFPLLYAVQDVVTILFNERGRVISSTCHAVLHGRSVDLERVRKLEIQDVR